MRTIESAIRQTRKAVNAVADICLYGNGAVGAGWLAATNDCRMFGTGEPRADCSFTEAVWEAQETLVKTGLTGMARVFTPSGHSMAIIDLQAVVTFGDLKWQPAPVYTISAESLIAAAEKA